MTQYILNNKPKYPRYLNSMQLDVKSLLIAVTVFCTNTGFATDSLLIKKTGSKYCRTYFKVSPELEPDSSLRSEMQIYLYQSLVDSINCGGHNGFRHKLFTRSSFRQMILLFYTNPAYESLSHFEYPSRWRERYDNLLRYCTNERIVYKLTDDLLKRNKSNGLIVLWEDLKAHKLSNFMTYKEGVLKGGNKYKCAELAVIFHNMNDIKNRDQVVNKIEKQDPIIALKLKSLFNETRISYERYVLTVLGGV